jgi:2-aminoadipate transaminase
MNWTLQFARSTENMRRNTVREFLKHAKKPEMISFGGGLPAPELFPVAEFAEASQAVLAQHGAKALQYGETEGVGELRDFIAAKYGVAAENVLITNGAQQALDLLGRVLIDKNDAVAVENPTYLALLSSWRVHEPSFEPVNSDADGLRVGELRRGTKLLYLVPNFQNPQGSTLSLERRIQLAECAQREEMIVVEDDPYGDLRYDGEALPSIFSIAGKTSGPVVSVGTFSKVLAPGLRVGWVVADRPLIEKLVQAKQAADLQTSTLNQYLALKLATGGLLETQVPRLCNEYRCRRDAMLQALNEFMPAGVLWSKPAGGMFLLLTLPGAIAGADVSRAALAENVLVVPGEDFHVVGGENTLRLNFSNCPPELIRTGIERLARIIAEQAAALAHHTENYPVSFSSG